MFRNLTIAIVLLLIGTLPAIAQDNAKIEQMQRKIQELEQKLDAIQQNTPGADLDELRRQIEILTREVEQLKVERQAVPEANAEQFGLGSAASKVYRSQPGFSFGGYGEMLYQNFDDRKDDGAKTSAKDQLDLLRAVLYAGYKFSDRALFNSELEVEHATTDDGIGEVAMEFAYLDFFLRPEVNVRAGLVLVPVGLINELHEPTAFLGARRPEVEQRIIPTTWRETGAGVFGDIGPVTYRTYVVTGLNSEEFSSAGIRSGRQGGAKALAEDFAWVGRVDWHPIEGTVLGGSLYTGGSSQGEETPDGESFKGRVTLKEIHSDAKFRGVSLRVLWADGSIGDAREINLRNGLAGTDGVGRSFNGWYAEAGYDLAALLGSRNFSLTPFVRYEELDTQESVPAGFLKNRERDQTVTTIGVAWKPISQAVIKADYQNFDNAAGSGLDQFNLALGYIF